MQKRKFEVLADEIRAMITSGQLADGDGVPGVEELRQHGHSKAAIQQAIRLLRQEGLIEGGQGRRYVVRAKRPIIGRSASYVTADCDGNRRSWRQEMADLGMTGTQDLGRVGEVTAPQTVADLLDLEEGASVILRPRVMLADGDRVQLADSYYPLDLASGTGLARQAPVKGGAAGVFERAGIELHECREDLDLPLPDADVVERLGVDDDMRVLRLTRTLYATSGRPVAVDVMTLRPDRHRLTYRLPAVS